MKISVRLRHKHRFVKTNALKLNSPVFTGQTMAERLKTGTSYLKISIAE